MDVLAINPVFNQLQGVVVRWDDKLAECAPPSSRADLRCCVRR